MSVRVGTHGNDKQHVSMSHVSALINALNFYSYMLMVWPHTTRLPRRRIHPWTQSFYAYPALMSKEHFKVEYLQFVNEKNAMITAENVLRVVQSCVYSEKDNGW